MNNDNKDVIPVVIGVCDQIVEFDQFWYDNRDELAEIISSKARAIENFKQYEMETIYKIVPDDEYFEGFDQKLVKVKKFGIVGVFILSKLGKDITDQEKVKAEIEEYYESAMRNRRSHIKDFF